MNIPAENGRRIKPEDVPASFLEDVRRRLSSSDSMDDVRFVSSFGTILAGVRGERGTDLLGCPLCISPMSFHRDGSQAMIGEKKAIPFSAISEDDSRNPDVFVLCPDCGRPIPDPEQVRRGVIGVTSNDR